MSTSAQISLVGSLIITRLIVLAVNYYIDEERKVNLFVCHYYLFNKREII